MWLDANSPGYYGYDDPRDYEDYEEWCDRDDPDAGEGYDDPFRPLRTGPVSMVDPEPGELDGCPGVCGFVGMNNYYAPAEVELMCELHCPDNCGMYCQLRYDIRPYGHYAPTDVEFYHGMHGPENCGEKCVTQSDGDSDICEWAVPGIPGVPGVPDVPDGSENCRAKCVTRSNAGNRASNSCHSDM